MIAIMMPLSSLCLRVKKAFSGNLITLVAVHPYSNDLITL